MPVHTQSEPPKIYLKRDIRKLMNVNLVDFHDNEPLCPSITNHFFKTMTLLLNAIRYLNNPTVSFNKWISTLILIYSVSMTFWIIIGSCLLKSYWVAWVIKCYRYSDLFNILDHSQFQLGLNNFLFRFAFEFRRFLASQSFIE